MSTLQFLNHPADRRSLVWSMAFFPLVPTVGLFNPEQLLWVLPVTLYLSFCAGVLTHYHNHRMVFTTPLMNKCYGVWLSIFYGFPIFSWVPTHNQNHHKFVNGPGDLTSTHRRGQGDSLYEALCYPSRSSYWQAPTVYSYLLHLKARGSELYLWAVLQIVAVVLFQLGALAGALHLYGVQGGGGIYVTLFLLPALFAPWSMMFINYLQHVGCDAGSKDNHSRNFVGAVENWFVFDAGLHTVHHENPGVHFSEYKKLHARRASQIHPLLNQRNVFSFLIRRYIGGRKDRIAP